MQIIIEGYRSRNQRLFDAVSEGAVFYGEKLLGKRMAKNILLEIKLTNNLKKKEGAYGLCHITDDDLNRPREFMIELDTSMKHSFENILIWLAHEMVHIKQFVRGELFDYELGGKVQWKSKTYNCMKYIDQPWEKEAYRKEEQLFQEFEESLYEQITL
jgi:hypothetical protein